VEGHDTGRDQPIDVGRDDESRRSLTLRRLPIRSRVNAGAAIEMEGDGTPG
jgi:hypothetical protein